MGTNNISVIKECMGCSVCSLVCKKNAIKMTYNKVGQLTPYVDNTLCNKCGLCLDKCASNFDLSISNFEKRAFVSKSLDKKRLLLSSSGGISDALAIRWLNNGGVVCGASLITGDSNKKPYVKHICVDKIDNLYKIQGSKYVQSDIQEALLKIKQILNEGKRVLFFGTSCQVAALKKYVGNKYLENIFTVDLICHGVIGSEMFENYLEFLEKRKNKRITSVRFRRKDLPSQYSLSFNLVDTKTEVKEELIIPKNNSSYYRFFLGCIGYRESCYKCKYASVKKPSDITLGDYFEAENDYPELLNKLNIQIKDGLSSVIVHSINGMKLLNETSPLLLYHEVSLEKVVKSHPQLNYPSKPKMLASFLVLIYKLWGWKGVNLFYRLFDGLKRRPVSSFY